MLMRLTCRYLFSPKLFFIIYVSTRYRNSLSMSHYCNVSDALRYSADQGKLCQSLAEFRDYFAIQIINEICKIILFVCYLPYKVIGIVYSRVRIAQMSAYVVGVEV